MVKSGRAITAVVFDMDGTLVSTQPLIEYCVNKTSQKYLNRTLPAEDRFWRSRPPARNIIKTFSGTLPASPTHRAIDDYHSCYREHLRDKAILFQEIPRLLLDLRASGRRLSVVTTEETSLMNYCLEAFRLRDSFDAVIGGDDVLNVKPDPQGILLALERMGISASESMMVGDSTADMLAERGRA